MSRRSAVVGVAGAVTAAIALAGCTSTAPQQVAPGEPGPISVKAADAACDVSATSAPAGTISFSINNTGTKTTEFYLYGTGDRIMGEVENIGPGLSRQLIVEVPDGGTYTTACKPGMVGDGIRAPFTVTGSVARSIDANARLAEATSGYKRYTTSQVDALVPKTQEFVDAVKAGNTDQAKALFPVARTYWERIEPVAESVGDLDPKIDARDGDLEPGVEWTGFHKIEKDLWVTKDISKSGPTADKLLTDVKTIVDKAQSVQLSPLELANGAKELLDEVATGKITGEEDTFSHTDLWDFQANLEGSRAAIAALRPVIEEKDAALAKSLDEKFAAAQAELDKYRSGDGWKLHNELSEAQLKTLGDAINALAEPISKVAPLVASK